MRRFFVLMAGLAVFLGSMPRVQAADFPVLLKRIPGDVNVLVLVDVDRLMSSAMAAEKGWKKQLADDLAQRPLLLPPTAHKLLRGISIDLNSQSSLFEITLLEMPKGISVQKVADKHQGYVESIGGMNAAWLPQGAYCVKLGDELAGLYFPANRQNLSRWIRGRSGQASSYLAESARELKSKGPQILLAIDLEDSIPSGSIDERLSKLTSLADAGSSVPAISKVFDDLRGARLSVEIDKTAKGRIEVSFSRDAAPLAPVAKPLLLEILSNRGMMLDEVEDWDVAVSGRLLTASGELTASALMRLSSIFEVPSGLIDDPEESTEADNPALYATQAHYKSVQALLEDLFAKKKQSFGQYAQWAEQYAKKIDRLPLVNVDKDMQAYSARISELLRSGAQSFKGVGIRSAGRQKQVWNSSYVSYGYYGWRNYDASGQEKRAIRGQEVAAGALDAAEMKRQIDEESAAIRKEMVARYNVEF